MGTIILWFLAPIVVYGFVPIVVYVVTRFWVESVLRLHGVIMEIAEHLIYYANIFFIADSSQWESSVPTKWKEDAIDTFRRDSSRLKACFNAVRLYWVFEAVRFLPPRENVDSTCRMLMQLSNSILDGDDQKNRNQRNRNDAFMILKWLRLDKGLPS